MDYHGAFNDWLAEGEPGYQCTLDRGDVNHFQDPFWDWQDLRRRHAAYRVEDQRISVEPGWRLIAQDSYRDLTFQRREVFTYQAVDVTAPSS
jgi:hypothetical protein